MTNIPSWDAFYKNQVSFCQFLKGLGDYDQFLECIVEEKPRRVLEVGCGPATKSIFLSYLDFDCTAIDNNPRIIDIARSNNDRFYGHVRFALQDAFALDFADDSFDVAHHSGLLEHFSDADIVRLLREQLRVARKVVFTVPNSDWPRQDYGNERLLSRGQWEALLGDFKLEVSRNFFPIYSMHALPSLLREALSRIVLKRDIRKSAFYLAKISR